jgi:hypothetical protein
MRQSCFFPTPHPLIVISAKAEIQRFRNLVVEHLDTAFVGTTKSHSFTSESAAETDNNPWKT